MEVIRYQYNEEIVLVYHFGIYHRTFQIRKYGKGSHTPFFVDPPFPPGLGKVDGDGETAIISDFKHIKEYKNNFGQSGLQVEVLPAYYFTTFPSLAILKISKA